ncbi:DNA topoisomerase I [Candidatus Micrarchaeota archaeon]|nr:DNA topoisomerase I [Candidatus Micrarchaeota archaeon]
MFLKKGVETVIVLISEKPQAALRIALALGDGKAVKKVKRNTPYFEVERDGKKILVLPAAGHLYGLVPTERGYGYPVFGAEWVPTYNASKGAAFTKGYLENIIEFSKASEEFISSTDYDLEGEVIAANIIEFACKAKKAKRMKFSTLTTEELVEAFENVLPSINTGMVEAGRTRHYLDFAWGLSLSRALMAAIKKAGVFKVMSIGRVQGPSLALLAAREEEISAFVPRPYWQLFAYCKGAQFVHENGQFFEKSEAETAFGRTETEGVVKKVECRKLLALPPVPYDLTSLQIDAYRAFGFSPSQTLDIAQSLYEGGVISYPRTSSQKLPEKLNLKKIVYQLNELPAYAPLASQLISQNRFKPREGPKEDPAHPAIFPTGNKPSNLTVQEGKLFDLISKRFLSTFAPPAKRERMKVELLLGKETFLAEGARTIEEGWIKFFAPYARFDETILPDFKEGESVKAEKIEMVEKETKPPKRLTQASLIKKLEELGLGTKATRAEIIKTLYDRGYVSGKNIQVTPFGMAVYNSLRHHSPEILREDLTRNFEEEMEQIQEGKKNPADVIDEGKAVLTRILDDFRKKESAIGAELLKGLNEAQREEMNKSLGKCNLCRADLVIKRSKYGFFVACSAYPNCKNTFPLPRNSSISPTGKVCEKCGTPIIIVKRKGKRTFQMCLATNCETKRDWGNSNYPKETNNEEKK